MNEFQGKVAIVTGGTSGIGRAAAVAHAGEGEHQRIGVVQPQHAADVRFDAPATDEVLRAARLALGALRRMKEPTGSVIRRLRFECRKMPPWRNR